MLELQPEYQIHVLRDPRIAVSSFHPLSTSVPLQNEWIIITHCAFPNGKLVNDVLDTLPQKVMIADSKHKLCHFKLTGINEIETESRIPCE